MLKDWFSSLPASGRNDTVDLASFIAGCQRESFSGLLRLEIPSGELFLWTFTKGKSRSLFEYHNDAWTVIPESQWRSPEGTHVDIHKVQIPVQGIRTCEAILTAEIEQMNSMVLSGAELLQRAQGWCERSDPGFIHLDAENRELFGLFLGDSVPNLEVLFFNQDKALFSVENPDDLPVKADVEYEVRLYVGNSRQEIWLENRLRLAFAALVRMMLQRFGYMVGFALADRLSARLTEASLAQGLDIKITVNGLENNHLFHSLEEASEAYSFMLKCFFEEASVLIGPRMAKEIAINMLENLSPTQSELLSNHLRELRAPQFRRAGAPGKQTSK